MWLHFQIGGFGDLYLCICPLGIDSQALGIVYKIDIFVFQVFLKLPSEWLEEEQE